MVAIGFAVVVFCSTCSALVVLGSACSTPVLWLYPHPWFFMVAPRPSIPPPCLPLLHHPPGFFGLFWVVGGYLIWVSWDTLRWGELSCVLLVKWLPYSILWLCHVVPLLYVSCSHWFLVLSCDFMCCLFIGSCSLVLSHHCLLSAMCFP